MLDRSDLHDYQPPAIRHLVEHERPALWCPMGGGKGVCTLTALDDLSMVEKDIWPALALGTLRVARSVWPNEPQEWSHLQHIKAIDATGDLGQRKRAFNSKAHIYSINYEQLAWLVEAYGDDWPFKTVISDESTRLAGFRLRQGTKRARALGSVAHTKVNRFINLTGTPTPNGLINLWGQTWFQDQGERLGRTFTAFEQRWFSKGYDGFSMKPMPHAEREIQEKLKDICLTVEGLPVDQPVVNNIYVDLPPAARALYRQMEMQMFAEIDSVGIEAFNAASKSSKMLQIASGSVISDTDTKAWSPVHEAKLDALESVIEEANGMPVLVAYQFVADKERILKKFPKAHLLGDNPKEIEAWNAGAYPIMVVHPKSAGHGINLARGGNILAFFGIGWAMEEYLQVIERLGPMRQKQAGMNRPCFVHHILARDTLDEQTLERMASKRSVQDSILAAMRRRK